MAFAMIADDDDPPDRVAVLRAVSEILGEIIEGCIADHRGCVAELSKQLELWETTDYKLNLSHQEKKSIKGDVCIWWSKMLSNRDITDSHEAPLFLARVGIKCLLDCYFDPPTWNTKRFAWYLSRAILNIFEWGCTDLLPSKSEVKEGIQESFDHLMRNIRSLDVAKSKKLLSFLLKRHPDRSNPNHGWLLDFQFSAENLPNDIIGVMIHMKLYSAISTLLERGASVVDNDVFYFLKAASDKEFFLLHELVKRIPKEPLQHILIDKVIKDKKFNFAAIVCLHRGDVKKFMQLACFPDVCVSNIEQLVKMLTPKDCSNLFNELCSNQKTGKCLIVLESGNCLPNDLLPIIIKHDRFILETKGHAAIIMELLKLHSSSINTINEFFKACASKRMLDSLKYKVALVLAEKGGDFDLLKLAYTRGKNGTAIHGAVELCLRKGDTELLSTVCGVIETQTQSQMKVFTAPDSNKSSPYHLIMTFGKDMIAAEICDVLSSFNFIDPTKKDKKRKTPIQCTKDKIRMEAYKKAVSRWNNVDIIKVQQPSKSSQENIEKPNIPNDEIQERTEQGPSSGFNSSCQPIIETTHCLLEVNGEVESVENKQYESEIDKADQQSGDAGETKNYKELEEEIVCLSLEELMKSLNDKKIDYFVANSVSDNAESESKSELPKPENDVDSIEATTHMINFVEEVQVVPVQVVPVRVQQNDVEHVIDFSSLPWEMFISKQAADLLKAAKTSKKLISDIKKKLKRIGEGEQSKAIRRKAISTQSRLFETLLYDGARIIWCEDIQYSESKSNPAEGLIVYCDVIKIIWIALKHSTNQLNDVLQRIKESLNKSKGSKGKELKPQESSHRDPRKGFAYPRTFYPADQIPNSDDVKYHPMPNLYGGEFSVMQFHPFSEFINAMLNSDDPSKRECSISMSQQEHEIIKLPYGKEPLIVCGRSGTGKTTTCIYRMWNEFRSFWETLQATESENENDVYDSLRQVFVTKSPVLCSQVKKEFDKLLVSCKADDFNRESLKMNSSFHDCDDNMFPLFLTSKKLLFILDASLPGEKFFSRDENKDFKVEFKFSDYDETKDPEKLFQEAENSEENENNKNPVKQAAIEVNADYFCDTFWKQLPESFRSEKIDPLLVWTEIHSFIKGSMEALESKEGFISRDEYKALGRHAAPSFAESELKRDMCYDIFEQYRTFMNEMAKNCFIFDENDFVFKVYTRFQFHVRENPLEWHIDHFYIDEVQDFTQAELCLLLRICRNPCSTFCTGDVAQSIMKGVFFRFEDLKTQFFKLSAGTSGRRAKLLPLTENFRSHSGVLNLGQALVDILKSCFTRSFRDSNLPQEEAMFKGPEPILLQTNSKETLVRILLGSDPESSSPLELGAHQAILVRSDNARKGLPEILKGGIVLTVLEAKGLEFNDVLLYNFFSDSQVKDQWRFLYNIIEEQHDHEAIEIQKKVMGKMGRLHSYNLEAEKQEERLKSLSADLKHLYTAITRARVNLWIYEEGADCEPFFLFCLVKKLARLIDTSDVNALHNDDSLMFAAPTPAEQWCKQGDYYFSLGNWDIAMNCYKKGKCEHKCFLTQGYKLFKEAQNTKQNTKSKDMYKEAGCMLLCADNCKHAVEYIEKGMMCLRKAACHIEAAELLEKMEKFQNAAEEWMLAGHTDRAVQLREQLQQYSEVIRCYVKSGDYAKALLKAKTYEREFDFVLEEDVKLEQIACEYIRQKKGKNKDFQQQVLELVSDGSIKAALLIEAGMLEEAADELIKTHNFDQACRILVAKGLFQKGYESIEDKETKTMFLLYDVISLLVESKWSKTAEIDIKLTRLVECSFHYYQARSQILLGIINRDGVLLQKAMKNFLQCDCLPGAVLAFSSLKYLQVRSDPSDDLSNSKAAFEIAESIRTHPSQHTFRQTSILREVVRVHDLENELDQYFISSFLLKNNICSELHVLASVDTNEEQSGMLMLDKLKVNDILSSYYAHLSIDFVSSDYFTQQLLGKIESSNVFAFLRGTRYENLSHHNLEVFFTNLRDYIDYCSLTGQKVSNRVSDNILLNLFSPSAAFFLNFEKHNLFILRNSKFTKELLEKIAMSILKDAESTIESYLVAFRILTKFFKNGAFAAQQKLQEVIESVPKGHRYMLEHTRDTGESTHVHIFKGWLIMNRQIHKSHDFTDTFWSVYNFFLKRIAKLSDEYKHQAISIGSINYIVSVFSTSLLVMLNAASRNDYYGIKVLLPTVFYHNILNNFDIFNGRSIMSICEDLFKKPSPPKHFELIMKQLNFLLSFLLGENCPGSNYNVLYTALTTKRCIKDGSAFFCLIQCLVLAGNLYCWSHAGFGVVEEVNVKLLNIQRILRASRNELILIEDSFVALAIDRLSSAKHTGDVFQLISDLLSDYYYSSELVTPMYNIYSLKIIPLVHHVPYPSIRIKSLVVIEKPNDEVVKQEITAMDYSVLTDELSSPLLTGENESLLTTGELPIDSAVVIDNEFCLQCGKISSLQREGINKEFEMKEAHLKSCSHQNNVVQYNKYEEGKANIKKECLILMKKIEILLQQNSLVKLENLKNQLKQLMKNIESSDANLAKSCDWANGMTGLKDKLIQVDEYKKLFHYLKVDYEKRKASANSQDSAEKSILPEVNEIPLKLTKPQKRII